MQRKTLAVHNKAPAKGEKKEKGDDTRRDEGDKIELVDSGYEKHK